MYISSARKGNNQYNCRPLRAFIVAFFRRPTSSPQFRAAGRRTREPYTLLIYRKYCLITRPAIFLLFPCAAVGHQSGPVFHAAGNLRTARCIPPDPNDALCWPKRKDCDPLPSRDSRPVVYGAFHIGITDFVNRNAGIGALVGRVDRGRPSAVLYGSINAPDPDERTKALMPEYISRQPKASLWLRYIPRRLGRGGAPGQSHGATSQRLRLAEQRPGRLV